MPSPGRLDPVRWSRTARTRRSPPASSRGATPSSKPAGRWRQFAETFGSLPAGDGDAGHHVDGGFTFLVRDNLQLDLSFGRGIAGASDWFVGAGVSVRLPR
ncbi:MAG: transporter [Gemmatimonadetes bacterium]|nr:transporter [Gemmatimonadota bacterium]